MKFEKDKILAQLDKIVADKAFSRSKMNVRLLTFLINSTLEHKDLKEMAIGTEFFGSKYDPIKSDNKVRVYIYHLRKKLEEYYSNSATPDEIVFSIAKGQYEVRFEKYHPPKANKRSSSRKAYLLGGILLLVSILTIFLIKKNVNSFWSTLMANDYPTTVVFGDYFTIEAPISTSNKGIIRDYEINSEQDLKQYLVKHPEQAGELQASRHHYFNWAAPYCSRSIAEFWVTYNYPFNIIQISEWSASQLETENLVYFGQSKTMGVLENILTETFPQYTFKSQRIIRTDPITNKKNYYGDVIADNDKNIDFTVVAKVAMPTGNEMRFFLSDQDCGTISALNFFTNNDSVASFYNRHHIGKNDDFIALFKVTGWLRKSYDMEFILLDKK